MKQFVDENVVMQFYLKQIEEDNITFLTGKAEKKKVIHNMVKQLLDTKRVTNRIGIATQLWKVLFEAAMSSIDSEKQGYDRLYDYFEDYVEFEELIFASDSFYRDHTLHCIWVYFLGVYIDKQSEFEPLLRKNRAVSRQNDIALELYTKLGLTEEKDVKRLFECCETIKKVLENQDAMFCVEALTHDLGYPLKKIEKINKSIRKILPYYAVQSFGDFKFEYGNINQLFIEEFIKLITHTITVSIEYKTRKAEEIFARMATIENGEFIAINDEAIKNITDEEREILKNELSVKHLTLSDYEWKVSMAKDFESYQHGIMSAFILSRNLLAFQNIGVNIEKEVKATPKQWADYMIKEIILNAISQHTCESYRFAGIDYVSFLTFIDELEEFSRISRASQSREYVEEFCKSEIGMEDGWFCIDFTFDNDELANLDPERAFLGRCKRFLSLFKIPEMDELLKIRLRCIGKLKNNQNIYTLEVANHHARIMVNDEEKDIPTYLKSSQFYSSEEYRTIES